MPIPFKEAVRQMLFQQTFVTFAKMFSPSFNMPPFVTQRQKLSEIQSQ